MCVNGGSSSVHLSKQCFNEIISATSVIFSWRWQLNESSAFVAAWDDNWMVKT